MANRKARLLTSLARLFARRPQLAPEIKRARELLAAIDAGGIPLNPAIVNRIARDLGLDIAPQAALEDTVARLRAAVLRGLQSLAMQDAAEKHKGAKP